MFYTFIGQEGSRLFHRFIDDQGDRQNEIISDYPFELFIEGTKTPESESLHGLPLNKIPCSSVRELKETVKEYSSVTSLYGQHEPIYQFLAKTYKDEIKFDIDLFNMLLIDIEVEAENGFPAPERADDPINLITMKFKGKGPIKTFSLGNHSFEKENTVFFKCETEKELLTKFMEEWEKDYPDIITGWNSTPFDIVYFVNRINKVFGDDSAANRLSPFYRNTKFAIKKKIKKDKFNKEREDYEILGISNLDYLELYKKYSYKNVEKYTLDHIAHIELGERKLDYSEYGSLVGLYKNDFNKFVDYNIRDVELVERLDDKLNFLFLAVTLAFIGKIKLVDIFGTVKFWDSYIYNELLKKNIQIPGRNSEHLDRRIEGAFVKDPTPGLYKWIVSFDLTSLYPSIIMQYNMSPETIVMEAKGNSVNEMINQRIDTSSLKTLNLTMTANQALFTRKFKGIMPQLVEVMFQQRKTYKNKMLDAKKELEVLIKESMPLEDKNKEIATFNAMQQAFKIALNSLYGAMANEYFRYFSTDIAEGITLTGQLTIKFISKRINEFLNSELKTKDVDYVIAGDSVTGDTLIDVNGVKIPIADYYDSINSFVYSDDWNKSYVKPIQKDTTLSVNVKTKTIERKSILHVMKHKVKKEMFKITSNGQSVIVTEDHSIIIERNSRLMSVKPKHLCKTDKIINIIT